MVKTLNLRADRQDLDILLENLEEILEKGDCPKDKKTGIMLSAEELFVNVADYAYGDKAGYCNIDIECDKKGIVIKMADGGEKFDPLAHKDPDLTLSASDRQIGGLGILMAKRYMDSIDYIYDNERSENRITLKKMW